MTSIAALREALLRHQHVSAEPCEIFCNGTRTFFLTAGSGPPLVLLHGGGGGGVAWSPVIAQLAEHFSVIAPDIIGYGESDKPPGAYDRLFFAEWLWSFLDALGITKTTIVGSSQGGSIAFRFALDNPNRVTKLVLAAPAGLSGTRLPLGALTCIIWMNLFPSKASICCLGHYLTSTGRDSADGLMIDYVRAVIRSPGGRRPFWLGKGKSVEPVPPDEVRSLEHPTLLIWGDQDHLLPVSQGYELVGMIPNARLHVIREAGHVPFADRPKEFADCATRFLREEGSRKVEKNVGHHGK